jgi:transcriptional regulator with XRE-family HTH domain
MAKTPDPIDKYVGSRVRMRRILLGFSQEKLGAALGLTFQQVQKYEKGTNRISASRLQEISKTLNIAPSYFFDGAPSGGPTPGMGGAEECVSVASITDFIGTAEGVQLNKAFARITNPQVRKRVIDLVSAIADHDEGNAPNEPSK